MPTAVEDQTEVQGPVLSPLQFPEGYVPGKYASWDASPEPIFGPNELGEYKSAVDDLSETVTRADSSARIWEVMQSWELRLMCRNYQFLNAGRLGWGMAGATTGTNAAAGIMQTANAMKLFSCNVLGAREDKIVPILSREVPALTFVPKRDRDPMDQTAADEAKKYQKVWLEDAGIKEVMGEIASLFYTDDRVVLYTRSVADEQEWDTETPDEQQQVFGAPSPEGVSPETELQPEQPSAEVPAVREITTAHGKLECKVPIAADKMRQMPWIRISEEQNVNTLKERYPWIEDKISAGQSIGGSDQLDRMARINVRLAVQSSSSSGESWQQDATETLTWYRPSQYRAIKDKALRKLFYDNFPKGLLVIHAGGELALIRNEAMNDHLVVVHPKHGSGQNRRAIGTNYLPLQKILNANISLLDRYFRNSIARRFAVEPYIDVQAINTQANDPAKVTPVTQLPVGAKVSDLTGVENVPQPNNSMLEFIQWLIEGGPEAMDGCEPSMFGAETDGADQGVYQTAKLKRDGAQGILSMPWSRAIKALAKAAQQAVKCASKNRVANVQSNVPGQGKLEIEMSKLQGNVLCYPESLEIPQTIAEQEAQMSGLLENGKNVALYQAITNDPRNLPVIAKFPSLSELEIPGLDAVEQQQGEFELLLESGPLDNPQFVQVQEMLQQGQSDPEAATPEGQQAMQQLQQQAQSIPPKTSSVPVAQDGSQNHLIHAAITLGLMNGAEGRKLQYGDETQQAIFANLKLHWQEHVEMSQKLTPPKEIEIKGSVTIDPTKLPPEAQAKAWQAIGLEVSPQELTESHELVPREVTVEREGVDAQGVPIKQKTSMVNPSGKLPN